MADFDCGLCGVQHDAATHAATLGVRAWLKAELERKLAAPPPPVLRTVPAERAPAAAIGTFERPRVSPKRIAGLTPDAVLAAYRRGTTTGSLALALHCATQTIHANIMRWRRASAEFRAADEALATCPACRGVKPRHMALCWRCGRAAHQKAVGA